MDSVTLFNILLELKKKKSICLSLFHVNYNMHSKSDLMHKYCVQLAQDNNIQIFTRNFNYKLFNNSNIESKARDYRYNEIKNICLESKIKYCLTAHHQDDQIETIYMARKNNSSWVSKIGIRVKKNLFTKDSETVDLLRPMLDISKKKIINYTKKNKLQFLDDPTNKDKRFLRNKIRLAINSRINNIKFRKQYLNIADKNKLKLIRISKQINKFYYDFIYLCKNNDLCVLDKIALTDNDYDFIILFLKKILREQFNFDKNLSSVYWKNLYDFINGNKLGSCFILDKMFYISKTKEKLYIYKKHELLSSNSLANMGNHFFRLGTISISKTKNFIKFNRSEGICLPLSIHKKLKVDYWEHGDKCLTSKKKTFKVSDIFINNKLSFFHKKHYPLVKYLDNIIWIPTLFSYNISVKEDNVNEYIILKWNLTL